MIIVFNYFLTFLHLVKCCNTYLKTFVQLSEIITNKLKIEAHFFLCIVSISILFKATKSDKEFIFNFNNNFKKILNLTSKLKKKTFMK